MMAAATPRLRPLLRALRAQRFRGPVWCCGAPAVRGVASGAEQPPPPTPPPPSPPPQTPEAPEFLGNPPNLGEPRLEELGLGGSSPVGMIQNLLEFLHLDLGLPWWGAIAAGTVGARILLLPLVLRGQREAARLSRHLPELQRLSQRVAEARRGTDQNQGGRGHRIGGLGAEPGGWEAKFG
ncbi:mitochondrial inner membrane protein OXA1L-like isoform X2 [Passer montanus]|uniref:mitochondrial inner membrane protein OXA1L-like isoform X2 n=1 Tax=Passer montanus TaxID=9160 RepID=UPI0019600849|nr:mitochondrial inner membrane protein OXA1L-like isoform X2 [Passer montanus]